MARQGKHKNQNVHIVRTGRDNTRVKALKKGKPSGKSYLVPSKELKSIKEAA